MECDLTGLLVESCPCGGHEPSSRASLSERCDRIAQHDLAAGAEAPAVLWMLRGVLCELRELRSGIGRLHNLLEDAATYRRSLAVHKFG